MYDLALQINPNFPSAYSNKGNGFTLLIRKCTKDYGKFDKALKIYDLALMIDPNHA